jgi:hypothetical protein
MQFGQRSLLGSPIEEMEEPVQCDDGEPVETVGQWPEIDRVGLEQLDMLESLGTETFASAGQHSGGTIDAVNGVSSPGQRRE